MFDPQPPDGTAVVDPPPPPGTVPEAPTPKTAAATPVIDPPPPPGTVPEGAPAQNTLLTGAPGASRFGIYASPPPAPAPVDTSKDPPPPADTIPEQSVSNQPVTALDAAGGSLKAGVEGLKQIGPAVGLSAAQRQLDAISKIDQGQPVDPNDDPLGYSVMSPEQRAKAKTQLVQTQAQNIGTLATSVQEQQNVPTDPGVKAFQEAKGWGQTFSALGNAPVAVLQDAVIRGLPSLIPTLAATMAGGPAAGVAVGTIGVGPSAFAGQLVQAMQAQGVDINNPDARAAWVAANGDTIKSLYDRAMNVAAATTVAQVGPFEAARVVPIASTPGRIATGTGLGATSGAAAPVVESAITGEPVSPQAVVTGGTTGAVFGATGGAGGERPVERPVARPPRPVDEQRLPPAAEVAPEALRTPPVPETPPVAAAPGAAAVPEPPPPPGTVPAGVVEVPKPPEAPPAAETPETPVVPPVPKPPEAAAPGETPAVPVGAPVAAPKVEAPGAKVEAPRAKVESPTPGSSTPTGAAAETPEQPGGQEQGGPEGDRTAVRAPAEQPARPSDVGTPDTGRVQPAEEPGRAGGEQPAERGAVSPAPDTGRAPGAAVGAEPAKAQPAVEPSRSGETGAPGRDETPPAPRPGDVAPDTGRAAGVAEPDYSASNPHPESIGARIDQLEQAGRNRTEADNAELQRLYAQRTELDRGSEEHQAKQDELAQVNQQISDAEKAVAKSEVRKGNAIVASKSLIAKRDTLEALRRQRDAVQDELNTLRTRDSAQRVQELYGKPRPDAPAPKPVSRDTGKEPTAFLERSAAREIPTSRERAVSEAHENTGASPFREIFRDAGHDPDAAVQLPIANQARIAREQTAKRFGFREITSGQKHSDTVAQLSNFYQNAKAYAHVRGIPYEAVGLHGRLAMELERKHARQGYLGVYHPGSRTIGLPGRTNSFAHERMHAVDHYLAEITANNPKARRLLSETASLRVGPHVPGTTEEAFAKVIGTLYGKHGNDALDTLNLQHRAVAGDKAAQFELLRRETDYARNAREFGDAHGGENLAKYYYRPAELLARADEAYTAMRVEAAREQRIAQGHDAPFDTRAIAKPDAIYSADGAHALTQAFEKLYPKLEDRAHIFEALRQLDDQMTADHLMGTQPRGDLPTSRDMVNPRNWSKMANTSGKKAGIFAQEIAAWSHPLRSIMERLGMDPTRPKAPHSVATRAADAGRAMTYTGRGLMETVIHRQPEAARSYLNELKDHLAPAEGIRTAAQAKGRYLGDVYEQSARDHERANTLAYAHAMEAHDLVRMTPAEQDQFFQVMHGYLPADDPSVDPRIREAASKVRYLLTNELHRAQGAGLDVGHVGEGAYFPIQFDDIRIMRDPDRFERQAIPAYGHTFDRDTARGQNRDALISHALELRGDQHDQIRVDARRLQRMTDERAAIVKRLADGTSPDVVADQTRLAQLDHDTDALHRSLVPDVRDAWSRQSAEDMKLEATLGGPTEFDTRGPASSFMKGRVFTPEGHELLKDFIEHNPDHAIPGYFHTTANKIAYAEHFGIKNPKTGKVESSLIDQNIRLAFEHGAIPEDLQMFKHYVETATGQTKSALPGATEQAINFIHGAGSMALMTRSAFSSLGEPVAMMARTGNVHAVLSTLGSQIGSIFHETKSMAELRELAEAMGQITSSRFDSVVTSRLGPDYSNTPSLKRALVWFYRRIGLTALTNNQKEHSLIGAHIALRAWAKDFVNPSTSRLAERNRYEAAAQFRDLGIPDQDHATLAQYIMDKGRVRTKVADLDTEGGRLWARAASRLIGNVIQDPLRVEKPLMSQNSVGKLAFGLMGFNYSFYHNVVERTFGRYFDRIRDAEGIEGKVGEMLRGGGHIAASALAIYGASLATSIVREAIFNQTKWQDMVDQGKWWEWISDLAIQRTGVNGAFDPIQQAITGLRYEKSVSSLLAGAQLGFFLNAAEQVVRAVVQNSPHTNTADYNALKGIYSGLLVPAETLALTALPGGPLSGRALGALMMAITGPGAGDWFAKQFVGPKGAKANEPGEGYGTGYGPGYEGYGEGYTSEYDKGKAGGGGADTGGGGVTAGLGLADDVAVPMMRWMMRLPGPIKALGATAATLWGASELAKEFGRFSNPDQ